MSYFAEEYITANELYESCLTLQRERGLSDFEIVRALAMVTSAWSEYLEKPHD